MTAIFNELEPYAAQWLTRLSDAGHVVTGRVDTRDIREVQPDDIRDAVQFHAFAGIGVWSYALRLAGWPDSKPVWTGSCPCQPFSVAGRGDGVRDPRHLWPDWFRLIRECRPPVVFGEQVASPDGLAWLDAVRTDLEGAGYAVGAADLCAAGVGAPHIRQRLYFVGIARDGLADANSLAGGQRGSEPRRGSPRSNATARPGPRGGGESRGLADADAAGRVELGSGGLPKDGHASQRRDADGRGANGDEPRAPSEVGQRVAEPDGVGRGEAGLLAQSRNVANGAPGPEYRPGHAGPTSGFWSNPDWVACRDGKQRPVEPGSFPLAHGAPARVGRLRAYGNAIVSEVAATFIRAVMEATS